MICPKCNAPNKIIDVKNTYSTYIDFNHRYLQCANCGSTFQSFEKIKLNTVTEPPEEIKDLFPNNKYRKEDIYLKFKDKPKDNNRKAS